MPILLISLITLFLVVLIFFGFFCDKCGGILRKMFRNKESKNGKVKN